MIQASRLGQIVSKRTTATALGGLPYNYKIGKREVVGFGMNGRPDYVDNILMPFPAIKFRELTPEFKALEEKAKGDWHKLSMAEKKQLYRISFCSTLAEIQAPTGEWKSVVGWGLTFVSLGVWLFLLIELAAQREVPETLSKERQQAQLRRMLDLQMNPVDGLSSKWDYEKNMWKKDVGKESK